MIHDASRVAQLVKNPTANARGVRDMGSILGWGRFPGEGNSNLIQYSCLENLTEKPGGQQSMSCRARHKSACKQNDTCIWSKMSTNKQAMNKKHQSPVPPFKMSSLLPRTFSFCFFSKIGLNVSKQNAFIANS